MGMNLSTYINMLKDGVNNLSTEYQNVSRYALVSNNTCVGVTLWNGDTSIWTPPENATMVQLENNSPVSPGWLYSDGTWTAPPPIEVLEETP